MTFSEWKQGVFQNLIDDLAKKNPNLLRQMGLPFNVSSNQHSMFYKSIPAKEGDMLDLKKKLTP